MCSKREPIVIVIPEHEQKAWTHLLHAMKTHLLIDQKMIEQVKEKNDPLIPNNWIDAFHAEKSAVEKLTDKLIKKTYDHGRTF